MTNLINTVAGDTIEISAKAFYNIDNKMPGANVNIAPRNRSFDSNEYFFMYPTLSSL